MQCNRDIFPTDILIRKIGIETTFNKERKSYFEKNYVPIRIFEYLRWFV